MSEHSNVSLQDGDDGVPNDINNVSESAEIVELREKLRLLQEIQIVQSQIIQQPAPTALPTPSRTQPVIRVKPPVGLFTMSPADYRSYKKDCTAYQELTNLSDHQVVLQLRLSMDADLKRIIDTNHTDWDTMMVEEAVNAVGEIVKETSNPVVYRKQFKDKQIQDFVTKLRLCA